jgi:hypothetical protein
MVREGPHTEAIPGVIPAAGARPRMGGRDKGLVNFALQPGERPIYWKPPFDPFLAMTRFSGKAS